MQRGCLRIFKLTMVCVECNRRRVSATRKVIAAWSQRVKEIDVFLPDNEIDVLTGLSSRSSLERFVDCVAALQCPSQIETYIAMFEIGNIGDLEQRLWGQPPANMQLATQDIISASR